MYDGAAKGQGKEVRMGKREAADPGQIDAQLRRAFQEVESSPVPDKLLSLLEQLRAQDAGKSGAAPSDDVGHPDT